jgi:hypothetical protein
MIKKMIGMMLFFGMASAMAVEPFETYDYYTYYGDLFDLKIHRGNVVLIKYKNDDPLLWNDGKPVDSDHLELIIDTPVKPGGYKILELELRNGNIINFWETTIYVSEHRSCFGPIQMVPACSNK